MNLPLSTAFTEFRRFWVIMFSFSFISMHIFISSAICWLFGSLLFSLQMFVFIIAFFPCCCITSIVSEPVRPHGLQPTRLLHPWDSPGKNTGVGCHFLLQCMKVESESEVAQSYLTLSDAMDCSRLGSSIHGIFQARVLEYVAIAFSVFPCS